MLSCIFHPQKIFRSIEEQRSAFFSGTADEGKIVFTGKTRADDAWACRTSFPTDQQADLSNPLSGFVPVASVIRIRRNHAEVTTREAPDRRQG